MLHATVCGGGWGGVAGGDLIHKWALKGHALQSRSGKGVATAPTAVPPTLEGGLGTFMGGGGE